jgi:alkanesulfonate monooxygenase SsuD/methylene tetrahydromethanopterin reductase-like flavin-dependent oxidoreductase (luciferase family)
MSQRIRLGFLTHSEGAGDPRHIYQETLELFVAAEQLGFEVGWLAEHHFKEVAGRLPSLFPMLAAAAQRTRRIRLGASVILLPFTHPLRVAEDAAVVDALSDGRLELGVGSGGDPLEFEAYGVDLAKRHPLTTDALATLQRALRGEALGASGQTLQPPAPTLVDRLWQSAVSVEGAQYVATQRAGLLLARSAWMNGTATDQNQLPVAQAFQAAWPASLLGMPAPPLALSRGIYPAADKRTALAELRTGVGLFVDRLVKQGQLPSGLSFEAYCGRLHIAYGHPEEIVEFLLADKILPFATDLILQFNPATPPLARAIQMFEQIATQIAPALGWQPGTR